MFVHCSPDAEKDKKIKFMNMIAEIESAIDS